MKVYIDFETRSMADIRALGGWLYAAHPTTDVNCIAYRIEGEQSTELITRMELRAEWHDLAKLATDEAVTFVAHNAAFEQAIWTNVLVPKYGFPEVPINRWRCTMAKAYAHGLPGGLAGAAKALQLPLMKDVDAIGNMLELAKPNRQGEFIREKDAPEKFQKLYDYCILDVDVTIALDQALPDLNRIEQEVWEIDQRINQEGVHVDLATVKRAIALVNEHKACITDDFTWATALEVSSPTQRAQLKAWVESCDVELKDTKAATVKALINDTNTPKEVRMALSLVKEASKTSLAKYPQMLQKADENGIIREILAYHAAHTGRWGGRGVQIQNLPRPLHDVQEVVDDINALDYDSFRLVYGDVAGALSSALRGMLVAPAGSTMLVSDLSQMEARVLAWLAEEHEVLEGFRRNEDLYCKTASGIYGYTVNKKQHPQQRQVGKVADLALGYQGGIGAFAKMAGGYGLDLEAVAALIRGNAEELEKAEYGYMLYLKRTPKDDQVRKDVAFACDIIKQRWRAAHKQTEALWNVVDAAAMDAVETGEPQAISGKVTFLTHMQFLYAKLPCGRNMAYPYPKVTTGDRGKRVLSYISGREGRITTYGGKLVENLVQAIQRDILAWALVRLERAGIPAAFHVHDEVIAYVNEPGLLDKFTEVLKKVPKWCGDLPIDAAGWEGVRYGKE